MTKYRLGNEIGEATPLKKKRKQGFLWEGNGDIGACVRKVHKIGFIGEDVAKETRIKFWKERGRRGN